VPFVERLVSYPKTVLVMAAALTVISAWGLRYIHFDYNLLNLQAVGTESVVWEKRILATAGRSGFTALASADTLDELRQKYKAFRALPSVSEVDSVLLLIPNYRYFVRSFQRLHHNLSPKPIGLADVPKVLSAKFISDGGRFLLQIHQGVDIWDREGAQRFVSDLRSVDPDVTGTPVITYEALHLMERAYRQGTIYAILLVTLVTALTLRRTRETALALLPLGLGLMWAFGLMYFFGLQFNMGNVFGLPLILGAAAEYGLNIVLRFMEGRDHGGPAVAPPPLTPGL